MAVGWWWRSPSAPARPMTIGYFHGGRTNLFFRAYCAREFERAGVDLRLSTRNLGSAEYSDIPLDWNEAKREMEAVGMVKYGKVTGVELMRKISDGTLDGGMIGESSFLQEIDKGNAEGLVAIAELGHDTVEMPGHCIIFRRGVKVRGPQDMKGLILSSRRAGPGDEVFLREFLVQNGLDPDRDVVIKDGVSDDLQDDGLAAGVFDGGYYHLMSVRKLVKDDQAAYVYRPLDWVPADLSLALLVFRREYVQAHLDDIMRMLRVYVKRIDTEYQLPRAERVRAQTKGQQPAESFLGMDYPQCDIPPVVNVEALRRMQQLLRKHGFVARETPLAPYIDDQYAARATTDVGLPLQGYKVVRP